MSRAHQHESFLAPVPQPGWFEGPTLDGATASVTTTQSRLYLLPRVLYKAQAYDGWLAEVTGSVSSTVRAGIYSSNDYGFPSTLIQEHPTTVDGTSVTIQTKDFSRLYLSSGIYWDAIVAQGGAAQLRGLTSVVSRFVPQPSAAMQGGFFFVAGVTGALPATIASLATNTGNFPIIRLRTAA